MLSCSGLKAREHPQDNSEKGEGTRDARLEKKGGGLAAVGCSESSWSTMGNAESGRRTKKTTKVFVFIIMSKERRQRRELRW